MIKTTKDGTPLTCKFCHKEVWLNNSNHRFYDVGGESLHVDNCPSRKQFYKARAYDRCENQRQQRER